MRLKIIVIILIGLLIGASFGSIDVRAIATVDTKAISANFDNLQLLPSTINSIKSPTVQNPKWLQDELDAEAAVELAKQQSSRAINRTVTYDVTTRGVITANLAEFKSLANQTLNDSRGWARLGVGFSEVASGGSFTLVLSEANQVPTFSDICSIYWSCRVGHYVVINQDRWLGASDAWNGSLRDYRNMVINHETGHWLGHFDDNAHCGGAGQSAPIMQQQSINLLGCSFNPWPKDFELWSSQLGI